ncbi:MAG: T9SS type A sorting domain-containing protein [Bacteroidota bacterium]
MKKRLSKLTVAVLMIAAWSPVHSDNRLVFDISGTSLRLATTGNKVSLVLRNSGAIKAIQLKAVSNTPGVTLKEVQRGNRTLGEGWTVQYNSVSESRMNVLIANLGNDLFQAGEGTIAEIVFDVNESIAEEFLTLTLEEIKAVGPQGNRVELLYGGDATIAVTKDVHVQFIVTPLAVSLSIDNRSEIYKLRFEAELEGATSIAQAALRGRAEGMQLRFEQFSNRVVVVLDNARGISIKPGNGEILNIPIQSSSEVRFVVQEMSLFGSDNKALESRVSVIEASQQPQLFSLHQNYPNPFNPSTTISYELPTPTHVTLKVYNMFGQEVATLVRREQTAGKYSFLWNGTNEGEGEVSSGTYIYRLMAGEASVMKKMILLK